MNRKLMIALLLTVVTLIGVPGVFGDISAGGPNGVNIASNGDISAGGPNGVNIRTTTQPTMTATPTPMHTVAPTAPTAPTAAPTTAAPRAAPCSANDFFRGHCSAQQLVGLTPAAMQQFSQFCADNPDNPACNFAKLSGIQRIRQEAAPVPAGPGGSCKPGTLPIGFTGFCV